MRAARLSGQVVTTVSLQDYDLIPAHVKGLSLHVVYVLMPMMYGQGRERHGQVLRSVASAVERGQLTPVKDSVFPLEAAAAAHDRVDSGQAVGKVVVRVEQRPAGGA